MEAIELLESQHDELKDLFEDIEAATGRRDKLELFQQIADTFAAHATIEEKIFYPAAYMGELKEKLLEAVEEHLAAKRIVADLLEMGDAADDEVFTAKISVLKETILHHIEEEESETFERVRDMLSERDLEMYGAQMEAMFSELMQEEPRNVIPNETEEAALLPR